MNNREKEVKEIIVELEDVLKNSNYDKEIQKMEEDQAEWLQKVYDLIRAGKLELAKQLFYSVILDENGEAVDYWLGVESAIMSYVLKMIDADKAHGITSCLLTMESFGEIIEFYYRFKFLIRRFEFDLCKELQDELDLFIEQYQISEFALIEMIRFDGFYKVKLLNEIAMFCMWHQRYDYVIPLLMEAIQVAEDDTTTEKEFQYNSQYNLAYFLSLAGES